MRNLFIMHTQYNLILSNAVVNYFMADENILVLDSAFILSKSLQRALEERYSQVIVVSDHYEDGNHLKKEIMFFKKYKNTKVIWELKFDRVFLSQENDFDTQILTKISQNGIPVCGAIEEDAYYSWHNNESLKEKRRTKFKHFVHDLIYGKNLFFEPVYCYGMSSIYKEAYLLYPDVARKELCSKKLIEIKKEDLLSGIKHLYKDVQMHLPDTQKFFVVFFDLMSRYKNKEKMMQIVREKIEEAKKSGMCILVKYHPRETEKILDMDNILEIDRNIPGEKLLYDLYGKDVTVLCNASATTVSAAKIGYNVYSFAKYDFPEHNEMHNKMKQMGIQLL